MGLSKDNKIIKEQRKSSWSCGGPRWSRIKWKML